MKAQEAFKHLLNSIAPTLRAAGYRRRGGLFRRDDGGATRLISYQKSQSNTASSVRFTINLGADLEALGLLGARRNSPNDCPWNSRLGRLLTPPGDRWWVIVEGTDLDALTAEHLKYVREVSLPTLERVADPAYLISEWSAERGTGITAGQKAVYLAVLLTLRNEPGDAERARSVLRTSGRIPGIVFAFEDVLGEGPW